MERTFKVLVNREGEEALLKVTHNGYQWSTIYFCNRKEIQATIKALSDYCDSYFPSTPDTTILKETADAA